MTTYNQPPVMTDAHIAAMRSVCSLWPYVTVAEPTLLADILRHLETLQRTPVPCRSSNHEHELDLHPRKPVAFDDWRTEYKPLAEPYESDQ